jgi:hypothetical protein
LAFVGLAFRSDEIARDQTPAASVYLIEAVFLR